MSEEMKQICMSVSHSCKNDGMNSKPRQKKNTHRSVWAMMSSGIPYRPACQPVGS